MQCFLFFSNNIYSISVRQTSSILLQGVPRSVPLQDVNDSLLRVIYIGLVLHLQYTHHHLT